MKKIILLICLFFLILTKSDGQSGNRVALVIGNSNYDIGALRNPVNDAELMKQTLEQLDFDVFYGSDLSTKIEMLQLIREFGRARTNYDVAFVYYAGHGIQIGGENFLLPTKEIFESEFDAEDFGVSVQNIIRYLNNVTDKVNIFVLDACRNNPFESQWEQTRAINKSSGLAKMSPPTGSLIAFSTEAGTTAYDGQGENSIYCQSLTTNMMIEGISLDQIFRNVRSDVLKYTNQTQRPIEASQLTGETYYLIPKSNTDVYLEVDSLLLKSSFIEAEELVDAYLRFQPNDYGLLTKKGHLAVLTGKEDSLAATYYRQALNSNPSHLEAIISTIQFESTDEDLGLLYHLDSAETHLKFEEYLQIYPNNFTILLARTRKLIFGKDSVQCCLALTQLEEMKKELGQGILDSKMVTIGPDDSSVKMLEKTIENNFMYVYLCLGKYEEVIEQAEVCMELDQEDPWPHFMNARACNQLYWLELDSVKADILASRIMRSYRSGLELSIDDKRLTALMIVEFFENASYLRINTKLEEEELNHIRTLAEDLIPKFDSEYSDKPAYFRNELRFSWALIECMGNENYFKALKICSQALGEIEFNESYPWFKMYFHEMEALIFFQMKQMDMYCESLAVIKNYIKKNEGVYYGRIYYTAEEVVDAIAKNCE